MCCKDCPSGHVLQVQKIKNHASACSFCFYVHRGSFAGLKQLELVKGLKEHTKVREKWLGDRPHYCHCPSIYDFCWFHFFTLQQDSCARTKWPRLHVQVVVMLRFDQCRKDQVELRVYFPRKKARHVKCNYQDLVRRSEEDYVDFRQAWAGGWKLFQETRKRQTFEIPLCHRTIARVSDRLSHPRVHWAYHTRAVQVYCA